LRSNQFLMQDVIDPQLAVAVDSFLVRGLGSRATPTRGARVPEGGEARCRRGRGVGLGVATV
jgi:hypothetical protein